MANYPHQFDHFKTHHNLVEDVDANDINKIQDAVVAIQKTIGTNPTRYEGKQTKGSQYDGGGGSGFSGGIQGDPPPGYEQTDRDVRKNIVKYKNIDDRLDALERGGSGGEGGNGGLHYFHYLGGDFDIPNTGANINDRPYGLQFPQPTNQQDPYGMFNGAGATLQRDGFWVFHASIVISMKGHDDEDNYGLYNLAIDGDGDWLRGLNRQSHFNGTANVVVIQAARMGTWDGGTKVTLRASHNANTTQRVYQMLLSGYLLKENNPG